jgi:hypothetical protein
MLGSIVSGFVVVGDPRDFVANVIQLDLVGALFSGIGVIPVLGDSARVVNKITEFIGRHADKADELFAAIAKADAIPREVKIAVLRAFRGGAFDTLVARGIGEDDILKLARGRQGLDEIAIVMTRPGVDVFSAGRWFPGGRAGGGQAEDFLRTRLGGVEDNTSILSTLGRRFPDHRTYDAVPPANIPHMHEVKTGYADFGRLVLQAKKDFRIVADGQAKSITWHFMASEASSTIGPSTAFFDELHRLAALEGVTLNIVFWTP